MAIDDRLLLQLAVDAAVALLHAAGVPRHVKVKEIVTAGLEIQAFTSGVGRNQNAKRILLRDGIECLFDRFAFVVRRWAMVDGNAVLALVGPINRCRKLLDKVSLGVVVLGEDDNSRVVPGCAIATSLAKRRKIWAHMLTNPLHEFENPSIRRCAEFLGDLRHFVEEFLFAGEKFFVGCAREWPGSGDRSGCDLGVFLSLELIFRQSCPVIVTADASGQKVEWFGHCLVYFAFRLGFVPLSLHGAAVDSQRPRERFNGGQEPLLQIRNQQPCGCLLAFGLAAETLLAERAIFVE